VSVTGTYSGGHLKRTIKVDITLQANDPLVRLVRQDEVEPDDVVTTLLGLSTSGFAPDGITQAKPTDPATISYSDVDESWDGSALFLAHLPRRREAELKAATDITVDVSTVGCAIDTVLPRLGIVLGILVDPTGRTPLVADT
jgi:hypothetical protein